MPPQRHESFEDPAFDQCEDDQVGVVIMVNPYSTGCIVASAMAKKGYALVSVWTRGSAEEIKLHVPGAAGDLKYMAEIEEGSSLTATAQRCKEAVGAQGYFVACLAGGESGVQLADALSQHMGLRTNGVVEEGRCNKAVQQEMVRAAGLRSIRQACGSTFEEVESFLMAEPYPVVLKPNESAGSDGVKLCLSYEEAEEHFHHLMGKELVNGGGCDFVLCQEYLRGTEYVVDHVSCDGKHKTMMLWKYDKRPANGSKFVYYGCLPLDPESEEAKTLIPYVRGVLDAIGIKNGPTHGEVILNERDGTPCLVEMNCRANGGNGVWHSLAVALAGGYSQIEATVDAYLDTPAFFNAYPDQPSSPLQSFGQEVQLVSYTEGIAKSLPGYEKICQLDSFVHMEPAIKVGQKVVPSVDLITNVGDCVMMNSDKVQLAKDMAFIRQLEIENQMFEFE